MKFNIISSRPLLSRFQKLAAVTTVSTNTLALPLQENKKGFFFFVVVIFFIIIGDSFFKCGSLGRAHLMHFKLITIFALTMRKVVLSVEK